MLNTKDFEYIYTLIERANVPGSEAQKVVDIKMKIIELLKSASQPRPAAPAPTSAGLGKPDATASMSNEMPAESASSTESKPE